MTWRVRHAVKQTKLHFTLFTRTCTAVELKAWFKPELPRLDIRELSSPSDHMPAKMVLIPWCLGHCRQPNNDFIFRIIYSYV